jgi:hypothetical protein
MSELAHRRPQSVAEHAQVDYTKALAYLGLNPASPQAHALVLVCKRYQLDPLLQHVELYDGKPYIKYSGYLHIANSNPHYEGAECVREWEDGTYNYATVRVHRDDRKFHAERTGKSRKIKKRKDGSRYEDDEADAKAFAQAHRRALRLAFNVDHPEPAEDHGETPAPGPVVEVARMIEEKSGSEVPAGASGGILSEGVARATLAEGPQTSVPDSTSPPAVGGGLAPPAAGPAGGDPTSGAKAAGTSSVVAPDPTSAAVTEPTAADPPEPSEDGEAIPQATDKVGPDDRGGQPSTSEVAAAMARADATTGPTPPPRDPSPVLAWCQFVGVDIRIARVHLRKAHRSDFGDLADRKDLEELRGERAERAIAYLDAWHQAGQESGG